MDKHVELTRAQQDALLVLVEAFDCGHTTDCSAYRGRFTSDLGGNHWSRRVSARAAESLITKGLASWVGLRNVGVTDRGLDIGRLVAKHRGYATLAAFEDKRRGER